MANPELRQIVAGPSREELFDALRLRHEGRKVTFTVAPTHITERNLGDGRKLITTSLPFQVQVTSIRIGDGSGECWLFELYDVSVALGSCCLEGFINMRTRKGHLKPK